LTGNIEGSIVVERDNIVIDGVSHTVQGTGNGKGIDLSGRTDVKIKNVEIKTFEYGIWQQNSLNNSIYWSNITGNSYCGIFQTSDTTHTNIFGNNITTNNAIGIWLYGSDNSISGNNITSNGDGIWLEMCSGTAILENNITANSNDGIRLYLSSNCSVSGNNIIGHQHGIWLYESSNNSIYHNNLDNPIQVYDISWDYPQRTPSLNAWDNGSEGNYWSDYNGYDSDHDGIGDTPYFIDENNTDHYPLMGMFSSFNTSYGYAVDFVSNSSISDFSFNLSDIEVYPPEAILAFNVSGDSDTDGFLRVCIPKILINGSYVIMFDGEIITNITYPQVRELPCSNETYEYLYINYTHSEHTILITGTTTIPEFPSFLILPLFMTLTLLTIIICKRRHTRKSCSTSL
jgi:parallel beta-helix repeat protein